MSIKENTLTKTGATIIISDISKPKNTYGEWFRIDKKANEFWIELQPVEMEFLIKEKDREIARAILKYKDKND